MKNFYSIGEVAKILNISTSKLRYYDKNGIISPEIRRENGYRYYSEKQIVLLKKISLAKRRGFHLKEIKLLLSEKNVGEEIIEEALARVQEEIEILKNLEKNLKDMLLKRKKEGKNCLYTPKIEYFDDIYGVKIIDETKISKNCFMPEEFLRKIDEYEENINLNIIKKEFKDLGNKETTGKIYVVLDKKNAQEEVIISAGEYATIFSTGHFDGDEGKKAFLELLAWIEKNKISIVDDTVYITFEPEIINLKENMYRLAIKIKR